MEPRPNLSFLNERLPYVPAEYDLHWQPLPERFRFVQLLGRGGMGEVWLAHDLLLQRRVAIKTVRRDRLKPGAIDLLQDEARKLAELCADRRIARRVVQTYDLHQTSEHCFVISELIDGCSFEQRVRSFGPLHWLEATRYLAEVSDVLAIIHQHGIAHRDVKPENLLWSQGDDQIVITDFGVAARDSSGQVGGTIGYLAPDVLTGASGKTADVFALGVTAWYLISGRNPFYAADFYSSSEKIRAGISSEKRSAVDCPDPLSEVLLRMMSADSNRRPAMNDVSVELRRAVSRSIAEMLPASANLDSPDLHVTVDGAMPLHSSSDRNADELHVICEATLGKPMRIRFSSQSGGYLALITAGTSGAVQLIPLEKSQLAIPLKPGGHRDLTFLVEPPSGTERVIGLLSNEKIGNDDAAFLLQMTRSTLASTAVRPVSRDLTLISPQLADGNRSWGIATVQIIHE